MAEGQQKQEEDFVIAFKSGDKLVVEQLLPSIPQPATITTSFKSPKFKFSSRYGHINGVLSLVSLLHLAAYWGWRNIITALVSVYKCAADCKDEEGHIPIHYATSNGHLEVVKYFIGELHCDPTDKNNDGETPLHYACHYGHLKIAQYLIRDEHCNPSCENDSGNTPLHYACYNGFLNIVKYLIRDENCNPSCANNNCNTPLHYACDSGYLKIIQYLIREENCNPLCENKNGNTPLDYACCYGHLKIVQYLVREGHCNPSCGNNNGDIPLHHACSNGHINIVQYLIREENCNPSCENSDGWTPLHYACIDGHLDIAQYLIREEHCNPSCEDKNGKTPLHYACQSDHAHIVEYLLSTGRVNPLSETKSGFNALFYASGKYDIIKLFEPFEECRTAYPVHTFTKLILTGDSGAGKTTITELIVRLASSTAVECVADVQRCTAGIIPHHIQSEQLGNFVVYDFAGQQEYYSSHDAVLEQVMRRSAAMFVSVVDLNESKEKICESLHYWLSFIDNACSTAEGRSHVVIIGSHADQVTSSVEEKSSLLHEIATRRVRRQDYIECIAMDCRRANTDASRRLIAALTNSQKAITASQPVIHYYSHVIYAFLRTKLNVVGCALHDLVSAVTKEKDSFLPSDQSVLTEILATLSDKGLILFIHHPHSSWVIVKTEALLNEINGTLFAPDHFKEHHDLASNTGIVPVSNLHKVFPDYNSEMLVGFLTSLDFCRPVDPSVLQYTNLQTTPSHSTADLLFFPGLIQSERPNSLIQQGALEFGWCLKCMDPHEFLSSRFLHLLLLSVAYEFPLASRYNPCSSVSGLQRKCKIWRNGIFWRDDNNTCAMIELLDNNRCVMVAMSYTSTVEYAKLRGSLIALIRHLLHKHSPAPEVCEFLISPDLVRQYPIDTIPDTDLFDMYDVARSILQRKPVVLSHRDGHGLLKTQSLPFEPYHLLDPSYVSRLFNPNMADHPVPGPLLQEVKQLCCQLKESLKVSELREHLDMWSLFAGKNPLVSSVL